MSLKSTPSAAIKIIDDTFWSFQQTDSGLDVLALRDNTAYEKSFNHSELAQMASTNKQAEAEFLEQLMAFLTDKQLPGGKVYHAVIDRDGDKMVFVWKLKLSLDAELRLASFAVNVMTGKNCFLQVLQRVVEQHHSMQNVLEKTFQDLQKSETSRENVIMKYKEVMEEMKTREDALLVRFCAVLNSKKRKIRELMESSSSQASGSENPTPQKFLGSEGSSSTDDQPSKSKLIKTEKFSEVNEAHPSTSQKVPPPKKTTVKRGRGR